MTYDNAPSLPSPTYPNKLALPRGEEHMAEKGDYVSPRIKVKEIHCGMVMGSTVTVRFDIDVPRTETDTIIYIEL